MLAVKTGPRERDRRAELSAIMGRTRGGLSALLALGAGATAKSRHRVVSRTAPCLSHIAVIVLASVASLNVPPPVRILASASATVTEFDAHSASFSLSLGHQGARGDTSTPDGAMTLGEAVTTNSHARTFK